MDCVHRCIVRRLGDYPAYWICDDCSQHFNDAGGNMRTHPVPPPSLEKDGPPSPAV